MRSRRAWRVGCSFGIVIAFAGAACTLVTDVPDLTSGIADAGDAASADAACPPHVFTYDPGRRALRSVHVAGSFNGWPKTIDGGGWPLVKTETRWTLTREVPRGTSTYKLVLDESEWIADPSNPKSVSDGYGGKNSVLDVECSADR